ncbi:D-alanyl-D-alanine carboxypeptidase/D-alanyl-D-alanine-endopeptidase [Amycolatopsis sp. YIM 10]|uniref:D-alanyl-D-alanine carboxypeptidase/D-alanyl-D-alanine endopeptidase n=1 Tax=Amycolatopsis sp. YIM 10 TaxID=2653857 RepID=UPI0012A7D5F8|nr:D-alanyl-D-alanine carboxypeptidase/D-alanyl-D-alanine-endopeptidase [Amycolatopsis sp. YIM 10]QFU85741.1 D-alanyl-D-alanine carboxypeptidase DacB precursor [Amycolatopsis sp. YIM 10]
MPDRTRPDEPGWPAEEQWPSADHDGSPGKAVPPALAEQDTLWVRTESVPQATQPVQQLRAQGSLFQPQTPPEPRQDTRQPDWPDRRQPTRSPDQERRPPQPEHQQPQRLQPQEQAQRPEHQQSQRQQQPEQAPRPQQPERQQPHQAQRPQQAEHRQQQSERQQAERAQQAEAQQLWAEQQRSPQQTERQQSWGEQPQRSQRSEQAEQRRQGESQQHRSLQQAEGQQRHPSQQAESQQQRSPQQAEAHQQAEGRPQRSPQQAESQQQRAPQQVEAQQWSHQQAEGQQRHPSQQVEGQQRAPQQREAHQRQQADSRQPWAQQSEAEHRGPQVPVVPAVVHAQPMRIEPNGEQHPAPATTGADESPPAATEVAPRRRRKWPWIAAVLVVLLLLGGGGFAAVQPSVANRLELPWAPNKPRGEPPAALAVNRQLQPPGPSAPSPTPEGVAAALKGPAGASALGTLSGSVIDPATGTALWAKDANKPLTPASTTKVLTVAAALLAMDHGHQISTKVVQGADPGTAIVVAGGDPTINSLPAGKDSVYPGSAHLDDLVKQVMEASGGKIKQVQLDLSVYSGGGIGPGWAPEDAPSTYAAAVEPVMLDGGRSSATDEKAMRVATPAKSFAEKFASKLGASAGGNAKAPEGAKVLGEIKSAPLAELISNVLNHSDNLMGDALARQTALATGGEASFEGGAKATLDVLKKNGFNLDGVELSDGSGLSVDNRIPAKVLSEVLAVAAAPDGKDPRTAKLRPLLGDLSVAGGSTGRLVSRYTSGPEEAGKGWVRAKTGTLSGVNTLAGVVLDKDGHLLVFTLMSLGSESDAARSALDAVVAELRGCGCR